MSSTQPFLPQTIEPDEPQSLPVPSGRISGAASPGGRAREQIVLTPTNTAVPTNPNATLSDQEEGVSPIRRAQYEYAVTRDVKASRVSSNSLHILLCYFVCMDSALRPWQHICYAGSSRAISCFLYVLSLE